MKFFKKNKISNDEFSALLFVWLAKTVNNEGITKATEEFSLSPKKDELFGLKLEHLDERNLLFKELLALNMWIASSCSDYGRGHKENIEIIDEFHAKVYQLLVSKLGYFSSRKDFQDYLVEKYEKYNRIMQESDDDATVMVANLSKEIYGSINKNGYGKEYSENQISGRIMSYTRTMSSVWMNLIDNPKPL